jgi:large subunit ribosomal protein L23
MNAYNTILKNVVTEKSSVRQADAKQYTFIVKRNATKIDVKNAIKAIYGADVDSVRMLISPSKERFVGKGRLITKRPVLKKAIVSLKGGKTLDLNKFKEDKTK